MTAITGSSKFPAHMVRMILRLRASNTSYRQITRLTGASSRTIAKILKAARAAVAR